MARIAIERAPPTALPRRFLLTAPIWGVVAGLLLACDGGPALQTRWAPATLALVHALTLGVLGNAMFGGLLQFLPAAVGVRVRGGVRSGALLYVLLNLGAMLLVLGFRGMRPALLLSAAALLAMAFALLAAMLLPGLLANCLRALRVHIDRRSDAVRVSATPMPATVAGIAFAVSAGLATAVLGIGMVLGLTGQGGLPLRPWVDVHAGWGVLGWVVGLLASVGAVVLPMFQGTRALSTRALGAWLVAVVIVLGAATMAGASGGEVALIRWGAAACLAMFALAGLWLQWRAPHSRNARLTRGWRVGLLALLSAAAVLALDGPPLVPGVLVLGIALPWLVTGMQMEIVAFLGWIELQRRCGRGVRLPAVQVLLSDAGKAQVWFAQALAATALLAAVAWPASTIVRIAGIALAGSHALLCWRLHGVGRRVHGFVAEHGRTTPAAENAHAR